VAIIGDRTIRTANMPNRNAVGHVTSAFSYTAVANDFLVDLNVYGYSRFGASSLRIALYRVSFSKPRWIFTSRYLIDMPDNTPRWYQKTFTPIALTAGTEYVVCIGGFSPDCIPKYNLFPGAQISFNGFIELSDPWAHSLLKGWRVSMYGTVQNVPPGKFPRYPCCAQLIH